KAGTASGCCGNCHIAPVVFRVQLRAWLNQHAWRKIHSGQRMRLPRRCNRSEFGDDAMRSRAILFAALFVVATMSSYLIWPAGSSKSNARKAKKGPLQRFDKLAHLPFAENRPTKDTAQTLRDELLFHRATQTYLWAMPLVNMLGMKVGSEKEFGAGYNVLP